MGMERRWWLRTEENSRQEKADERGDEENGRPAPPTEKADVEEPEAGHRQQERDEAGAHDDVACVARLEPEVDGANNTENGAKEAEEEAREQAEAVRRARKLERKRLEREGF